MKKILTLLLVLALCMSLFVACKNNNDDPTPDPTPSVTYDAAAAAELVKGMYKDDLGVTPKDFTVVPQVKVGDVTYPVTWTVDTDKVTVEVSEDGKTVTVNVPEKSEEDISYKLTATITAGDGTTASVVFNLSVAKYETNGLVANPAVDTPYTFGMVQGNLENKIYYLKGGMNGYYLDTTDDQTKAMNVYLEATEGGYHLYCLVGETKTYINMVVNGEHVNGAYEATAKTVYTYDAVSMTLKSVVNEKDYWFGTRNDKSYTTVGPVAVEYNGFYCQFYTANTTVVPECDHNYVDGVCTKCEEKDPNYVPPVPTNPNASVQVEEGKGYTISAMNANGAIYFNGTVSGGRFGATDNKAEATVVYIENVEGGFVLYFLDGEVKTYVVIDDSSTGGSFSTDATTASVFEWNADKATVAVADDGNNRGFGVDFQKTYVNFSCYDLGGNYSFGAFTPVEGSETPEPDCEHNYVDGVCTECGEKDPTYVAPECEHTYENGVCTKCGENDPTYVPPVVGPVYNAITDLATLKTGDKILIGAPAYNKLLSMVKIGNYNVGVDYSATDFSKVTDDEIFVVTVNEDGTYSFTSVSGKALAMADSYSSLNDTGANKTWNVTAGEAGIFFVENVVRGNAIEWYNQYSNWSSYNLTKTDEQFQMSFYLVETAAGGETPEPDCEHNYVDGVCTECGEKDPEYVAPECEHNYVEGVCTKCGEKDPEYVAPECEHNYVDGVCTECGEKDPNYVAPKTVITIAEALEIAKAQGDTYTTEKYYITGIVTNISNTFYGNFHLVDADGNDLYVYGLKDSTGAGNFGSLDPQPAVGDTITIYTVLGCHYGSPQAKDAWLDDHVQHTEHSWAEATCKAAKTCTICGKVEGEPLEHNYVDGSCTGCGKSEPVSGTVVTSTESFAGLTASGSYKTVTTTSGWTATNAAVLTGGTKDQNPVFMFIGDTADTVAIALNGKTSAVGKLTSATLQNGISKLSFNYGNAFSEANGVDVTINILQNGEVVATTQLDNDAVTQKTAYEFVWELDQAVEGEFVIEIVNNSPTNNSTSNKDRIAIFNFTWDSAPIAEN